MKLTSDPNPVVKVGKGDPNCAAEYPFGQTLILQEQNGVAVKLTKFIAGANDYSSQIASWFGSQTLAASGNLTAKICWQFKTTPVTVAFEMDGVDAGGQPVQATVSVDFKDPLDIKSGRVISKPTLPPGLPRKAITPPRAHQTGSGMVVDKQAAIGSAKAQH